MMGYRPATESDILTFRAREDKATPLSHINAWAICDIATEEIMAIVGCYPFWYGTETIWALVSDKVRGKGVGLVRWCKYLIDTETSMPRLQAFVDPENKENQKFIQMLGFHKESTMIKGGPTGKDIDLYVRLI